MTLEQNVRAWLSGQGYPLEMRTAEILRTSGAWWDHGRVYADPTTGKIREIDLVGSLNGDHGLGAQLVIECKHSKSKPWVLFCTDRTMANAFGFLYALPTNPPAADAIKRVARIKAVHSLTFFNKPDLVGFNLVRTHTDNQDTAFHAVQGSVTSSRVLASKSRAESRELLLYIPIIVVDAPIMQCHLSGEGDDVLLEEVQSGVLLHSWEFPDLYGPGRTLTRIHVVNIGALAAFVDQIKSDLKRLGTIIASHATT